MQDKAQHCMPAGFTVHQLTAQLQPTLTTLLLPAASASVLHHSKTAR